MHHDDTPLPPTEALFRRDRDIAEQPGFADASVKLLMATPDMQASKVFRGKGSIEPERRLPCDTTGCLLSGRLKLRIGGDEFIAEPGDVWITPQGVARASEALEDSLHLEITAPGTRAW